MVIKVYKNLRNNIAHKKIDKKERIYGTYLGEPLLHSLVDHNYGGLKNFKKLSSSANRREVRNKILETMIYRHAA